MKNKGGQTEALRLPDTVVDGNPWDDISLIEENNKKGETNVAGQELKFIDPAPEDFNQPKIVSAGELARIKNIKNKLALSALFGYNKKVA